MQRHLLGLLFLAIAAALFLLAIYAARHGGAAWVVALASAALADADTATTVRHANGRPSVSDGPFIETVEFVGGYYDVELPDLDTAIEAASLLPRSYAVEIRPTVTIEGYESR